MPAAFFKVADKMIYIFIPMEEAISWIFKLLFFKKLPGGGNTGFVEILHGGNAIVLLKFPADPVAAHLTAHLQLLQSKISVIAFIQQLLYLSEIAWNYLCAGGFLKQHLG